MLGYFLLTFWCRSTHCKRLWDLLQQQLLQFVSVLTFLRRSSLRSECPQLVCSFSLSLCLFSPKFETSNRICQREEDLLRQAAPISCPWLLYSWLRRWKPSRKRGSSRRAFRHAKCSRQSAIAKLAVSQSLFLLAGLFAQNESDGHGCALWLSHLWGRHQVTRRYYHSCL